MAGRRPRAEPRVPFRDWLKVTVGKKVCEVSHEPFACSLRYIKRRPRARGLQRGGEALAASKASRETFATCIARTLVIAEELWSRELQKMPADVMEKNSSSPVAATPANIHSTPDKPKTASEHRKSSKPIMEKRRRARINESLGQLKTLILDALKKDSSRHSKLEKADILEMTVKHLRNVQRVQMTAALNTDPTVLGKYRAGFSECMNEVTRFLSTCEGVNTEVRTRLLGHLASCMTQINPMNYPPPSQMPVPAGAPHASFGQPLVQMPGTAPQGNGVPLNGVPCKLGPPSVDAAKVYGGFQLVPASDGQFAFLIPNTAFAHNGPVIPVYSNANVVTGLPSAVSPSRAPSTSSDSVWRPW